ncbi:RDD family protein [Actinomyces oris]|uniref:RDD family protein n=1 Tax=Actinomyces oris TaxID=544580 RepID=A0AAW9L307_9ACTO|nr:RDD family protein [Actinomyces oris]MEA1305566.1 RDD family protein [Actinomyces oris]
MTITADARSSASTAAGPPTSSPVSDGAPHTDVVSPYGTALSAPDHPHGDGSRGSEPDAARPVAHTPSSAHRRLPPAPVRARIVAGVIDLVIGSLLVGGLTTVIWQVGGRPVLTSGLIAFGLVVGARWLAIAATGWSLGGRLLRIRMLGARNQTPSPLGSFLHADLILAVSITTLGLGTIALMRTAAADSEGRGWHDKLSGMALLSAHRTRRPAPSAAASERHPITEPASSGPRTDAGTDTPEESTSRDIGEAWDAARRASLSSSDEQSATSREPASEQPSAQATEVPDESASRAQPSERAERKAEKKAGKAARGKKARKRGPRPGSTRARSGQESAQETRQATAAGAQSAAEAGITESSGRSAHPTTSDPVSSSIRRPRPARPGRPARHAGRALNTGSSSGYASAVSETSAEEQAVSTSAATTAAAPHTAAKATKAATVSSSASAKSAASAGPAIVETDAEAVAVASATPMDPQASAAMAAARAESRPAVEEASRPSAGPADEDAVATVSKAPEGAASPAQGDADTAPDNLTEATEPAAHDAAPEALSEPTSPTSTEEPAEEAEEPSEAGVEEPSAAASSSSDDAASQQPSPMDTETATLDVVEDAPSQSTDDADSQGDEAEKPSTHAPPPSQHPADQQQSEATTPSAESSKTAADSEASRSSTSHDATSTPQVPRSKATKPVTSQTMEPRHAHAQRWRIQPGHTGKKSSGSSAAPAEDQRESVSQPGVPRRESLFTTERQRFAAGAGPVPEVAHTFDTSSILPSEDRNTQALIDSVPWSSVPTSVDAATVDSLPEGAIVSDDGLPQQPKTVSAPAQHASPMDLTNPATVPGGLPAASEGTAHPTVRSHRSHARASADSATSAAAPEESSSRRSHASHRFSGPGIPSPADGRAVPGESRTGVSRRSAGSMPEAAAPASAPAAGGSLPPLTPVPNASAQTATPSLPSASSAAPALSVRLVPLLGGNPILIHEPTVVGRDPDNISAYPGAERVALDDPTRSVSKTHAAIFPLLDGVWVTDLHSTNGTRVEYRDGRTVEAVPDKALSALEGSTIFFGRIAFKVEVV